MKFHFVDNVDEVLKIAVGPAAKPKQATPKEYNAQAHQRQGKTDHEASNPNWQITMRWLLIQAVLFYRVTAGRLLGAQCRFTPSCSQYAIDAINKYGPVIGSWKAIKRITRCHPWGGHGYDPA